ncbi:MAG: rubredoxin [Spirochaetia bacterium]|jgi:rubrerythrin|nr:rubredoxin [Spirochaetia bacterium]
MDHAYSPILSNLAKACEKQYRAREAQLFLKLAEYFEQEPTSLPSDKLPTSFAGLISDLNADEATFLEPIRRAAASVADRGALRMATWGGKVNAIQKSAADRYEKKGDELLEGKSVFVCQACGFLFIGEQAPDLCPVCKVQSFRFSKVA